MTSSWREKNNCIKKKLFHWNFFIVLAGEENALGRFLKEEGKKDKTREVI